MSLESFFGLDAEGAISPEAAEKFAEQMRESARAVTNMTAHQAKQKKKEDKLAQLLIRLMKDPAKADLIFLVVKLLQENVPGAFILAVLALFDSEMVNDLLEKQTGAPVEDSALATVSGDALIPMDIKKILNAWGESILEAGLLLPGKTLATVLTPDQKLKSLVLDLMYLTLEEFFEKHGFEFSEDKTRQVALISIQTVLIRLRNVSQEKTDAEIIESPIS